MFRGVARPRQGCAGCLKCSRSARSGTSAFRTIRTEPAFTANMRQNIAASSSSVSSRAARTQPEADEEAARQQHEMTASCGPRSGRFARREPLARELSSGVRASGRFREILPQQDSVWSGLEWQGMHHWARHQQRHCAATTKNTMHTAPIHNASLWSKGLQHVL